MSGKTKIEWATDQWNPVTGCSKVSQGCKHCYAEREWPRLSAPRAKPNIYTGRAFTDVKCHPEKLDIPLRWTKPRRIFVNSMSDLFHESVPDEFIEAVFVVMQMANQHTFQVLTKRPERMLDILTKMDSHLREVGYPQGVAGRYPNIWLGVSVEEQTSADERIPMLLDTPAAVRWISAEPLLGPIDLLGLLHRCPTHDFPGGFCIQDCGNWQRLDWIVVGGESGPMARPMHPDWVRSLRDQCRAAGVPFFFKQWGEWLSGKKWISGDYDGGAFVEVPGFGETAITQAHEFDTHWAAIRIGKKAAGREIDGRTWDEYPS